jgi:hypothetical protein
MMLEQIDFWHWWILAAGLVIVEMLVPSFFALWMAIAAFIVGLALMLMPSLAWEYQFLIFALFSVISVVMWRHYYVKHPIESDQPHLNQRGHQYIGRVVTLAEAIVDGQGRIRIDDSVWKVVGPDCEAGVRVKIMSIDNVIFTVEPVDAD